tara:strand:+ start:129 stop:485 length:357 start_codon:yes stop_codon:yes gene_type:complete
MKKLIIVSLLLLYGCGSTVGYLGHNVNTSVVLSQANYKVIGTEKGSASASWILGFGPTNSELFSSAKADLLSKANLGENNKSQAIINITTDIKFGMFLPPIFISKTVYISADIIEFTK